MPTGQKCVNNKKEVVGFTGLFGADGTDMRFFQFPPRIPSSATTVGRKLKFRQCHRHRISYEDKRRGDAWSKREQIMSHFRLLRFGGSGERLIVKDRLTQQSV